MIWLGFMIGTVFGIFLVTMLGGNKYEEGYDKGYADGMSEQGSIKK